MAGPQALKWLSVAFGLVLIGGTMICAGLDGATAQQTPPATSSPGTSQAGPSQPKRLRPSAPPELKAPNAQSPGTPAPGTPAPGTPAPGTPAPGTPAPGMPAPAPGPTASEAKPAAAPADVRETVQADVSTRSVSITSSFTGTEIVVFGAVDNSRQSSAESGLYDVVIVLEGAPSRLVSRRKSNIAGIWINTQSVTFESIPSYYAIASTRPLDELADPVLLRENDIGLEQVRMTPIRGWETGLSTADLADFKTAVIRLKQKEGLYVQEQYGVVFIGRSLFRATIELPANVPVGALIARVHLLREGQLLSSYTARVNLERQGVERILYAFAFDHALLYGVFTVAVAVGAGLLASTLFRLGSH